MKAVVALLRSRLENIAGLVEKKAPAKTIEEANGLLGLIGVIARETLTETPKE